MGNNPTQAAQQQNQQIAEKAQTRKQFVDSQMQIIKSEHPLLTDKQIFTRANMLWKNKQKK
jgi:hypothetical protein